MRSAYDLEPDTGLDWRLDAACRGHDPELWTLGSAANKPQHGRNRQAVRICGDCPVRRECYRFAERTDSVGMIFGGVLFPERKKRKPPVIQTQCRKCRMSFGATNVRQRFCSAKCRSLTWGQSGKRKADVTWTH